MTLFSVCDAALVAVAAPVCYSPEELIYTLINNNNQTVWFSFSAVDQISAPCLISVPLTSLTNATKSQRSTHGRALRQLSEITASSTNRERWRKRAERTSFSANNKNNRYAVDLQPADANHTWRIAARGNLPFQLVSGANTTNVQAFKQKNTTMMWNNNDEKVKHGCRNTKALHFLGI